MKLLHTTRARILGASLACVGLAFACGRLEPASDDDGSRAALDAKVLDADDGSSADGGLFRDSDSDLDAGDARLACGARGRLASTPARLGSAVSRLGGPFLGVGEKVAVTEPGNAMCPRQSGTTTVALVAPPGPTLCPSSFTVASAIVPTFEDHIVVGMGWGGTLPLVRARWLNVGRPEFDEAGLRAGADEVRFDAGGRGEHTPHAVVLRRSRMIVGGQYLAGGSYVLSFDLDAVEPLGNLALVQHDEPRLASIDALSVRPDGAFWASGRSAEGKLALVRFAANDLPDPSFGDAGLVVLDGASGIRASKVAATPDGGALLAAVADDGAMTVRRFSAAGVLDLAYGTAGVLTSPFPFGAPVEPGRAQIALEPLTGAARFAGVLPDVTPSGALQARMTRLLPNGAPDPAFGVAGLARVDLALPGGEAWPPGEPHLLFDGSEDLGVCTGKLAIGLFRLAPTSSSIARSGPGVVATIAP